MTDFNNFEFLLPLWPLWLYILETCVYCIMLLSSHCHKIRYASQSRPFGFLSVTVHVISARHGTQLIRLSANNDGLVSHLLLDAFGIFQKHVQLCGINADKLLHYRRWQLATAVGHPLPHPVIVVVILWPDPFELWQGFLFFPFQQLLQGIGPASLQKRMCCSTKITNYDELVECLCLNVQQYWYT